MKENLRILHINDLHSHFEAYPKIKRFFAEHSVCDAEVIRLDLGDNIDKSHPMTAVTAGRANIELMNELGIDLATIGNNEGIGLSKTELNQVYDQAQFHVILNNLTDREERPSWAKPYYIYETRLGTKIAFLAYTFPYYLTYQPNGWAVEDPLSCLERDLAVPEVKTADFRILMSHLGIKVDEKITQVYPQIDLIIGAHTHHVFEEGGELNGTYLAAAGKYGQFVGEINLTFDQHCLDAIDIVAHETSYLPSEPQDKIWSQDFTTKGRQLLDQFLLADLPQALDLQESCQLLMDAMLDYAKADVVLTNSGLVVNPFPARITRDTLHHALPHQMRLAKIDETLEELEAICRDVYSQGKLLARQEIRGMGFRGKEFGQVLCSGFAYKNGKIVYNKQVINKKDRLQLVVVDQYCFASYFETIHSKKAELLFPHLLREVLEDYLRKKSMKGDL